MRKICAFLLVTFLVFPHASGAGDPPFITNVFQRFTRVSIGPNPGMRKLGGLFAPLGFSQDGKFAYLLSPGCGETGLQFCFMLEIVDLKNDEVLLSDSYNNKNFSEKEIAASLNKYQVVISTIPLLPSLDKRSNAGNDVFTPHLNRVLISSTDAGEECDYVISLSSYKKGSKILGTIKREEEMPGHFDISEVAGFLKSPFEDRVAIPVVMMVKRFEGETHYGVVIMGADLSHGFKRN